MPLALLGVGESGTITDIRGKEDVVHHLHNLGLLPEQMLKLSAIQMPA